MAQEHYTHCFLSYTLEKEKRIAALEAEVKVTRKLVKTLLQKK
jgi:hypothetical protein